MSISGAVHYVGRDMAVRAFENRKVSNWALFNNKQFLASCVGSNVDDAATQLDAFLDMMDRPGMIAVLTVKVYEDLKPGDKIKSNTPDDGSFNFRLQDPAPGAAVSGSIGNMNYGLMEILKKMDARLDKLESAEPEPVEEVAPVQKYIGMVKDVMEIPGVRDIISGVLGSLVNRVPPAAALGNVSLQHPLPPAAAAPAAAVPPAAADMEDPEVIEYTHLVKAYNTIKGSGMPDALAMLQRLADIAATDQAKFRGIRDSIKLFL